MPGARSKAYPAIALGEATEKLQQLFKKLGSSSSYNKETFAQGMGYNGSNNGAFQRAVAALIQYEMIQKSGNSYVLTGIAQKILFPTTSEDRINAIKEAALNPAVFSQIYNDYKGQELPDLLSNILVTNHGILPGAKDKVVSLFRTSMEYAGLLDGNRLRGTASIVQERTTHDENVLPQPDKAVDAVEEIVEEALVPLTTLTKNFGEGRVARLSIPSDATTDERENLKILIENM